MDELNDEMNNSVKLMSGKDSDKKDRRLKGRGGATEGRMPLYHSLPTKTTYTYIVLFSCLVDSVSLVAWKY